MTRRALCVGINRFGRMPEHLWLRGCVNDAEDYRALLTGQYGFAPDEVTVLTDDAATRTAVLGALRDLVAAAAAGEVDHLVVTMSSHGTQVVDTTGDERDRVDEAFATSDLEQDGERWSQDTLILDDELRALFARVPEQVLLDVVLDTCHSGSGLEVLSPTRIPRFLPPPAEAARSAGQAHATAGTPSAGSSGPDRPQAPPHVLLAACRSDETASDALFDGRYSGACTHFLVEALRADPEASRGEVLRRVRERLAADRFYQQPQLDAPEAALAVPWGRPYRRR
ncbi:caspase family protein [Georgenia sp. EYE_87]|uniref:caspase family protein n=1 Tax=Georgenia sp. EYE_87 TaxID=2853448 RepID=UPI002003C116|nr:caspase family protein [Georgenia sp. EYE_87]MCK6211592.1 caspase family protein [Georgenia sp. EYE_87]